jgi:sugar (pentulose or hexulose) kinase
MGSGYLGIDAGTQGLSVVYVDDRGKLVASGESRYLMVPGLAEGCYEQRPQDWETALKSAMQNLRAGLQTQGIKFDVGAVGISGQMHGEVLLGASGISLSNARLWCDRRNDAEGEELTCAFSKKIPKRMTIARWLWTIRNRPELARQVSRMTTPGGWLAFRLTGELNLGIGDASGMFPIDPSTLEYDSGLLKCFDQLANTPMSIADYLPRVCRAGQFGGALNETGSRLLGLAVGIPVAPAEGDQPASLAGSLIGAAGMVAVSFGTSVCANSVGDRAFIGVHRAIDHFCAPDGKPINMVFLRNGTTFLNSMAQVFSQNHLAAIDFAAGEDGSSMNRLMAEVVRAPADCNGVLATPFIDDEPGLGILVGNQGMLYGLNAQNATAGNILKAAVMATMFNLKLGLEVLEQQGFPRNQILLSGGLTRTPELGQTLADVLETPVRIDEGAAEGCAYGAALLARFCAEKLSDRVAKSWETFLADMPRGQVRLFEPNDSATKIYRSRYAQYQELLRRFIGVTAGAEA